MSGFPLKLVIQYAFNVHSFQILKAPPWLSSSRYDIDARMDTENITSLATSAAALHANEALGQQRLQALLAERFQLHAHLESRNLPVYALVVAKDGAKLEPPTGEQQYSTATGSILCTDIGMKDFAGMIGNSVSRTVVDRTGLSGAYKVQLRWSPDNALTAVDDLPGIFTALQLQLGLRLEPARAPVQVLIIDHVETPSAN